MPNTDIAVILSESEAKLVYDLLGETQYLDHLKPKEKNLMTKIETTLGREALKKFGWSE